MSEIEEFNTLRTTIIKNVLKEIYKNHTVSISHEDLFNLLTNKKKCKNINSKMIQCKQIIVNDSDFCEKHYINKFSQNYVKENILTYNDQDSDKEYIQTLDKKLIKDSFYFIDNKYNCIYDSDFNKVGIIKDDEFIFTTNPFLFEQW